MLGDENKADTSNITNSTSWRHSILGLFRSLSASLERTLQTGTAQLATAAVLRPALAQSTNSKTSFASANSGHPVVARHVRMNDFADSDTSNSSMYTQEEIQCAESIYSIIRLYEEEMYFRFDEDFDLSSGSETFYDSSGKPENVGQLAARRGRPGASASTTISQVIPEFPALSTANTSLATNSKRPSVIFSALEANNQDAQTQVPSQGPQTPNFIQSAFSTPFAYSEPERYPEPNVTPTSLAKTGVRLEDNTLDGQEVLGDEPSSASSAFPQNTSNRDNNASLSSGELLGKLDGSIRYSSNVYLSTNLTLRFTAGFETQSDLPVILDTAQDRDSRNTRWSAYDKNRRIALARPTVPVPAYLGLRSESNFTRSTSVLSKDSESHSGEDGNPRSAFTQSTSLKADGSSKFTNKTFDTGTIQLKLNSGNSPDTSSNSGLDNTNTSSSRDNPSRPGFLLAKGIASELVQNSAATKHVNVASPTPSVVQDTTTKQSHHNDMYNDFHDQRFDNTYEQVPLDLHAIDTLWLKWFTMMMMGLVAVPIYFMITFGFFDYGGHFENSLERTLGATEKELEVQMLYFRRYSRTQKILSFIFGIFWVLVVLAMIGVGFGLGVTRSP